MGFVKERLINDFKNQDNTRAYKKIEKLSKEDFVFVEIDKNKSEETLVRYFYKNYDFCKNRDLEKNTGKDTLSTTITLTPYVKEKIFDDEDEKKVSKNFKTKGFLLFDTTNKKIITTFIHNENLSSENKQLIINKFSNSWDKWNFKDVKNFSVIKMPFILIRQHYFVNENSYSHIFSKFNTENYEDLGTPPQQLTDLDKSENHFKLALNCYNNKDYSCSLENFKKAFETNFYNLDAHYNYAAICLTLGKKENACKKWKELIGFGQKTAEKEFNANCQQ